MTALAAVLFNAAAAAAPGVGKVVFVNGSALRQAADGTRVALARGDRVFEQDLVTTAADTSILLRFDDDTRFTLGPRAEFRVDRVSAAGEGLFSAEIIRGAFRFVTGLIAKKRTGAMRVRTGVVATIGIRGTTVGGEVVGESATIVLLESEEPATPSAIEVGNAFGSVIIDQAGYGTRVPDAHSPPSPPERMTLRAVENLVRNITNIQRNVAPRPVMPR
ncbi:MAG: FecR domain-containing protein [Gammaproteobacteria bacterium]